MMAQRRPEITPRMLAEQTVDRCLTMLKSSSNDAGWHGGSIIGRLIDFKGEIPDSSGFHGFSTVWEETRWLTDWPERYKLAMRQFRKLQPIYQETLLYEREFRGRIKIAVDPFVPHKRVEVRWDDGKIAAMMRITPATFRKRVGRAYSALEQIVTQGIDSHVTPD